MKIRAIIPTMYRSVDLNGTIQDCNGYYTVRMGYTIDEVIGSSILDHSPEENREEVQSMLDSWKQVPAVHIAQQTQLMTQVGEVITVYQTVYKKYEGDKVVRVDSQLRDAAAVRQIQDLYNVKARPDYEDPKILRRSVDFMGTIVECSQSYLDQLGYTRDEVIGISLYEHTALKSRGNLYANMQNWRTGFKDQAAKMWMRRKDGSEFPISLSSSDELDSEGNIVGRTVSLELLD